MKILVTDRNPDGRGRGMADGRVALISQAHPGEEIVAKIDKVTKGTLQGRVAKLLSAEPNRINPKCKHEFHCTGCPLLAAAPEDERAFKMARIREALGEAAAAPLGSEANLAALEELRTPVGPFGYRHFAKQIFARRRGRIVLGSHVAGTHVVSDNHRCPVLVPKLAELMDMTARLADEMGLTLSQEGGEQDGLKAAVARHSRSTGASLLTLVTDAEDPREAVELARRIHEERGEVCGAHVIVNRSPGNVLLKGELVPVVGMRTLEEQMLGYTHQVGLRSFFQVCPPAADVLFTEALKLAGEGQVCIEAFAGGGALTLPLSERFARVTAIESNPDSVTALRFAAKHQGRKNVDVKEGLTEELLPKLLMDERPDCVVLDPPRKGIGVTNAGAIARSTVKRVVLLSCEPRTLARDLPLLIEAGFRVESIVPVDQFPRTAHVETVTLLTRDVDGEAAQNRGVC